jgi:hypothetical protein
MMESNELVRKVMRLVNEEETDASLPLISEDKRSLQATILELLPQAVSIVRKNSPGAHVNVKAASFAGNSLYSSGTSAVSLPLPDDYASLVSVRLASWNMPCVRVALPGSVEALVHGNRDNLMVSARPLCVEGVAGNGAKALELSPAMENDTLSHLVYEAHFDASEGLNGSDAGVPDAVAYACAALLYNVFERYDAAKSFMSFALAQCGRNDSANQ